MNTREIAEEYRLSHWSEKMRERQELGLSIKAYCEQQGFHENIYYYWQRKLRKTACTEVAVKGQRGGLVANGWAHLRRKFDEALKIVPEKGREDSLALIGKRYCDRLFSLEREFESLSPEQRFQKRMESSKPFDFRTA